jgi:hypothetical protein
MGCAALPSHPQGWPEFPRSRTWVWRRSHSASSLHSAGLGPENRPRGRDAVDRAGSAQKPIIRVGPATSRPPSPHLVYALRRRFGCMSLKLSSSPTTALPGASVATEAARPRLGPVGLVESCPIAARSRVGQEAESCWGPLWSGVEGGILPFCLDFFTKHGPTTHKDLG